MNYYQHNIGDYRRDTSHLSLLEHGIYRQLLDEYYLKEKPIKTQSVIRRLRIQTEEEREALNNVLNDFFKPSECGEYWVKGKCQEVIKDYRERAETARANGKKGGRPKKNQQLTGEEKPIKTQSVILANPEKTQKEPDGKLTTNHKPITKNQEPNKNIVEQARHCIDYLNETCGTNYKHVDANTSLIAARLKEGHTVDDIKSVIDSKRTEWMDTDQQMYLRPKTLFSAQNFNNYIGQVGLAKRKKQNWSSLSPFELEEKCEQLGIHTKGLSPQAVIAELERAHQ